MYSGLPVNFALLNSSGGYEEALMHLDERRNNTTMRIREMEAQAVAFVVCSAIGSDE